jgi:hypothetical protein
MIAIMIGIIPHYKSIQIPNINPTYVSILDPYGLIIYNQYSVDLYPYGSL